MSSGYFDVSKVLDLLANDPLVSQYEVLHYEHTPAKFQVKLRVTFTDQSVLFTNDYLSPAKRKYAFQWQRIDSTWLIRWDNAPHFPKLASFPHHKHDYRSGSELVTASHDITLAEVLNYIQNQLTNPQP
ncbi:DUF6516 family protein [Spirosoma soli]|uniref:DUF6516 family protein n=1 Tax=Spirosoma soli TaxID=1770529 RepID=A0ABW5MC70_9BACT